MTPTRPRILFLNRSYWPDSEATGQLLTDLCESIADRFEVHVVCGQPNSDASGGQYRASGTSLQNGVTIHRLVHTRFPKRLGSGRIFNLLTFTAATERYLARTGLQADVIISETDPFLLPWVGHRHAGRTGARFVAYLQDVYPDIAIALGKARDGFVTRHIRRLLKRAYLAADKVIVLGEDMTARMAGWGVPAERFAVVPNWIDTQAVAPRKTENRFRSKHALEERFVVMHSGNMGLTQRLENLLAATRSPDWPEQAVVALVGDGAARKNLQTLAESCPAGRVRFFPYQPRESLADSLSAADLHVVSMDPRITGCLFPSKIYGILAVATPILMVAPPDSEPARMVVNEQIGWACPPGEPGQIAARVAAAVADSQARQAYGRNARALAEANYDRRIATQKFAEVIDEVLDRHSPLSPLVRSGTVHGKIV
ncbi:glycosyltransferase family 4 protein [Candidatus Laterigemmans baculatus]|uniref:glycosyltransferase family 4 protein n=1 Tax=Candidatus Laterigemmans baculatus TaxID=2770505 RepID=UPI0013D9E596|nr:glycosyltransferase family 4 protein [Candidatus Laterigemmans baculatus]